MKATTQDAPRLFVTDYASYNEGKQFEFGHWVDLADFSDAEDFIEYLKSHFEQADEKSPLLNGKREEWMFTDFGNFPRALYSESMGEKDLANLFEFVNLDEYDKPKVVFILEQGETFEYAISHYENVYMYENTDNQIYELFEMFYPDAAKAEENCYYLTVNYDAFVRENFTEFEYNGESYLIEDTWNK